MVDWQERPQVDLNSTMTGLMLAPLVVGVHSDLRRVFLLQAALQMSSWIGLATDCP